MTTSTHTIVTLAKQMSRAFVAGERTSTETGRPIRKLADNSPSWMTEVVHEGHDDGTPGGMLPDDWRYEMIETVIDTITECDDDASDRDIHRALENIEPDIYTSDLTRWLASRADRYGYCDEVITERGGMVDTITLLQMGQIAEYREIIPAVLKALEGVAEEMNDESEAE